MQEPRGTTYASIEQARADVTAAESRRDLAKLEDSGQLRRVHGGAVPARSLHVVETGVVERDATHTAHKDAIARAAATQIPQEDRQGACVSSSERDAIRRAAAACLAAVVKKNNALPLELPGAITPMIDRAEDRTQIEIQDQNGNPKNCFGHNEVVQVEVTYKHDMSFPLSPLGWGGHRPIRIVASAQAMLHTRK